MKITKAMRQTAADLCALMASSSREHGNQPIVWFLEPCRALDVDCYCGTGPAALARAAYWSIDVAVDDDDAERERWAEAESRLRTDWTPL